MRRSAMMLLGLLVAVALCAPASAAIETVVSQQPGDPTGPINPGWNLISLPAIPTNPAVADVLDECPEALGIGYIYRWDCVVQGIKVYDTYNVEDFGNMLLTEGYWLQVVPGDSHIISFEGITDNDNTDMWISLPKTGWTIIGCPFSYSVDWNNVEITDGTATVPLATARDNEWLHTICYYWDSVAGGLQQIGLDDDWVGNSVLQPWHGYWVQSLRDNLALIVPAETT